MSQSMEDSAREENLLSAVRAGGAKSAPAAPALSPREVYAAAALAGLLAHNGDLSYASAAEQAWRQADAMLAAQRPPQSP